VVTGGPGKGEGCGKVEVTPKKILAASVPASGAANHRNQGRQSAVDKKRNDMPSDKGLKYAGRRGRGGVTPPLHTAGQKHEILNSPSRGN
jgi:hypothetical protein